MAAETTAATVDGETITEAQVEQAARIKLIGNVALEEDQPVPIEVRRRALSFLIGARLFQVEQARLNVDAPEGLADEVGRQLEQDPAFAKLSDGDQFDLVSAAVVLSSPPAAADGSVSPGVPEDLQQVLVSDPAARAKFRRAHPQLFREICADVAQATPEDAPKVEAAMKRDADAAFEEFGSVNQCQASVGGNLVARSSPQWAIVQAVNTTPVGDLAGPITTPVANPDPADGGETVDISTWVRPVGVRNLTEEEGAELAQSLDGSTMLSYLALDSGYVKIDPRYGDIFAVGPPDGLQVLRIHPNGSGAATPQDPTAQDPTAPAGV
ncbi:MAG: hypothetical protein R2754_00675 [Microthrixaceae bacterium]